MNKQMKKKELYSDYVDYYEHEKGEDDVVISDLGYKSGRRDLTDRQNNRIQDDELDEKGAIWKIKGIINTTP